MGFLLSWAFVLAIAADATPLNAAQRSELAMYFGFEPMQIYKIKPGLSELRLADLDGDGRTDVVLWNAYQSRFEFLYQPGPDSPAPTSQELERNEVPDRGTMRRESVSVACKVASLDVGDFTGDGRPDLVYFGEPRELVILPGRAEGGFASPQSIRAPDGNPRHGSLCSGDFNHDGRADVALLGTELLLVFLQKDEGGFAQAVRLVHGIRSPMLMTRADLNGDGRDDLIIGADDDRYGVYACLQEATGSLAAFRPVRIPKTRSLTVAKREGGDDLYAVEYATNRLKQYRWELPADARLQTDWPQRLHSYPVKSSSKQRPLTLGDVDGDGLTDCVVVDPDAAQMILFRGETDGLGAGTAFPALAKTTDVRIVDIDGDGKPEVVCASPQEKMLGVSHFEGGRLTFPTPLPARGSPFALAVGSRRADGKADCIAYVTREDEEFILVTRGRDGADEETCDIDKLEEDPTGLRFVDVDQDGRNDLMLFARFAAPHVFLQGEDGKFSDFGGAEHRAGLLKEGSLEGFATADINGDGKPEVLLAQENLARALVVREGKWTVVDQYNPETADAKITGLAVLPDESGQPTLLMYDRKSDALLVLRRRADSAFAVAQSMPVGSFELTAMEPLPVGRSGRLALLLADPSRLAVLAPHEQAPTLVEKHSYESEAKDAFLADAVVGDLNHDGVRDVLVVDLGKASLEVLTTPPDGGFVRALRFQVFQGKRFADAPEARGEPREVLTGDVTGDRMDDVVLLVHDRVIIYPGQ